MCGKNAPQEQALCREVQEAVESGRITAEVREKLGLPGNDRVGSGAIADMGAGRKRSRGGWETYRPDRREENWKGEELTAAEEML